MLSRSSWFYFGPGNLYGAPFVTRCLLYRLHDINCSVLIYHEQNVTARVIESKEGPKVRRFESVCHAVTEVYVHYANSSTVALSKLLNSQPIQLPLSDNTSPQCKFGETGVMLERLQLPCKEMFSAFPGRGRQFEEQISETPYWVKGPVAVDNLGKKLEEEGELAQMRCWKISVGDLSRERYYDITEPGNWNLTAMYVEEDWKVASAMYLENRG
jgi:hypothetical protein